MSGAVSAATIAVNRVMRSASGMTWYSVWMFGYFLFQVSSARSYAFCSLFPPATCPMKTRLILFLVSAAPAAAGTVVAAAAGLVAAAAGAVVAAAAGALVAAAGAALGFVGSAAGLGASAGLAGAAVGVAAL